MYTRIFNKLDKRRWASNFNSPNNLGYFLIARNRRGTISIITHRFIKVPPTSFVRARDNDNNARRFRRGSRIKRTRGGLWNNTSSFRRYIEQNDISTISFRNCLALFGNFSTAGRIMITGKYWNRNIIDRIDEKKIFKIGTTIGRRTKLNKTRKKGRSRSDKRNN